MISPPRFRPTLLQAGTAVWLLLGMVLLANAFQGLAARPAAAAAPRAAARLAPAPVTTASAPADSAAAEYTPVYDAPTGREVVMVFIGASFCGAHRQPGFAGALEQAKVGMQRQARARGARFRAVAVSLDWQPDTALAFLSHFGRWDEMSVGGNWTSEASLRYLWGELPGPAAVPQVLILERHLENGDDVVQVRDEKEVRRIAGADQIAAWARSLAPS